MIRTLTGRRPMCSAANNDFDIDAMYLVKHQKVDDIYGNI